MLGRFIRIRKYHKKIIEHFENPRNIGSFKKGEPNVFTDLVGSPACGDLMKIELKIEDDIIVDCKSAGVIGVIGVLFMRNNSKTLNNRLTVGTSLYFY